MDVVREFYEKRVFPIIQEVGEKTREIRDAPNCSDAVCEKLANLYFAGRGEGKKKGEIENE